MSAIESTHNLSTAQGVADAIVEQWQDSHQDEDGSQQFTIDSEEELLDYLSNVLP